jgi:hypothetical protein
MFFLSNYIALPMEKQMMLQPFSAGFSLYLTEIMSVITDGKEWR